MKYEHKTKPTIGTVLGRKQRYVIVGVHDELDGSFVTTDQGTRSSKEKATKEITELNEEPHRKHSNMLYALAEWQQNGNSIELVLLEDVKFDYR